MLRLELGYATQCVALAAMETAAAARNKNALGSQLLPSSSKVTLNNMNNFACTAAISLLFFETMLPRAAVQKRAALMMSPVSLESSPFSPHARHAKTSRCHVPAAGA